MNRLKNQSNVIYDANIIIYYLFPDGKYRIPIYTRPAKNLTDFLFNQKSVIVVPHFIIQEIERKGYYNIINNYFKDIRQSSKLALMNKIKNNFENLKKNENFIDEYYKPSDELFAAIGNAFNDFNDLDNIGEYFMRKHVDMVDPSLEDKKLILFSKYKECPVISNDLDLTFFSRELQNLNLVHEIIDFDSLI